MRIAGVLACALAGAWMTIGAAGADEMQEPAFSLPREVVSAATAFQQYMASAAKIDAGFADGDAVARGLKTASAYEPSQMEEGMVAYGAIVALQDERFVAGVERAAGRGDDRAAFAEQLVQDPLIVTQVDGADEAVRRIEAVLGDKASALLSAGTQVKAAAYVVQHQAWSKVTVDDAQGRLADVKARSNLRAAPSDDDNQAMLAAIADGDPAAVAGGDAPAGYTAIEARALALAAESVLGRAHGVDRDRLTPLFSDADSAECLRMAKLNLYQCMAVAGPQYEDMYCMGQHAMAETARCVAGAAHAAQTQVAEAQAATQVASLAKSPADPSYVPVSMRQAVKIDPN
jgi:hypothetical protein